MRFINGGGDKNVPIFLKEKSLEMKILRNSIFSSLPRIQESRSENHHGLARALFELDLDGLEFLPDDGHHAFNFFG